MWNFYLFHSSCMRIAWVVLFYLPLCVLVVCAREDHRDSVRVCSTIYEEPNYLGQNYTFNDQGQSINLNEDRLVSESGWNTTGHLTVEFGCQFKGCNKTYFDGSCSTYQHGSHSVKQNPYLRDIASVKCVCQSQCNCSDIHIKKSFCGRAYLLGGCRICNTLYTTLDTGESGHSFPDSLIKHVRALRLRRGCNITIYEKDDFKGIERNITQETTEDIEWMIGSYRCHCNESMYKPKVISARPKSYPDMIHIPDSIDKVIKMMNNETYKNHPGLRAALMSYSSGRSFKNAYILILGSTGSGKSSVINLLFDNPNITKVGDSMSTTTSINEFRIPITVDELGIANAELRVIDTPGLGDTKGIENDAKFLATLDNYLSNHDELKDRFPNVVLILHKFNDNRFSGGASNFVKMIRGLDVFNKRIMDKKYSNVIFVLTHFCSSIRKKNPEQKLKQFQNVIEDFTEYPKPIHMVVAENKAKEFGLPVINGFFQLPNYEFYPKNLFDKIELITRNERDVIGLGIISSAFRDSGNFNITPIYYNIVSTKGEKVLKYLGVLANTNFGIVKTEITNSLQEAWDTKIPKDIRNMFPSSLMYLQKALHTKNIHSKRDLPETTVGIVELLSTLKQDEATRMLLYLALGIKYPMFPIFTVAGYSYDVFNDWPLGKSPFKFDQLEPSDIGFLIPSVLACKPERGTQNYLQVYKTKEDYMHARMHNIGVEGVIPVELFSNELRPGNNVINFASRNGTYSLSAAKDFHVFQFKLKDNLSLTTEFENMIKSLPLFNESNYVTVQKYRDFYNIYGTHVVERIYGGGSIRIYLETNQPFGAEISTAIFNLINFVENLKYTHDANNSTFSWESILGKGTSKTISFVGGNPDLHFKDIALTSIAQASYLLEKWKNSLQYTPAMLTNHIRLVPISHIVKLNGFGQNISEEIEKSTKLLFNSTLIYKPSPTETSKGPGHDRDNTQTVTAIMGMLKDSNEKFLNLTMEMRRMEELSLTSKLQMENRMLEWEKEKQRLNMEFQRKRAEADLKADANRQEFEAKEREARNALQLKLDELSKEAKEFKINTIRDMHNQHLEMLNAIKEGQRGGCLKPGTKILMPDFNVKMVDDLKVGDVILDHELRPTRVLSINKEFVMDQRFYGFEKDTMFFTGNHLFVGPSSSMDNKQENISLYTGFKKMLYMENPLMVYLDVTEIGMGPNVKELYHINNSSHEITMSTINIGGLFEDTEQYPKDAWMYDLLVEGVMGTYIANGYVCRHELPPVDKWPNTMSLMFYLLNSQTFNKLALIPYTVDNVYKFRHINNKIADVVGQYLAENFADPNNFEFDHNPSKRITLQDFDIAESISEMFNHPTVSTACLGLYAKTGYIIAMYIDNTNQPLYHRLDEKNIARLQYDLYDLIIGELAKHLLEMQ